MRRRAITSLLGIGVLSLGACASHVYAPGPGMLAEQLGPDAANCRLFAAGTRPATSFEASGSPKTVAVEAGAALLFGGIATAVHDSEAFDNCMQARGWLVADKAVPAAGAVQPAVMTSDVPQPVTVSPLPPPSMAPGYLPPPPVDSARAEREDGARKTAVAWLVAQNVLNGPASPQRHSLYVALCDGGDLSACFMAGAR